MKNKGRKHKCGHNSELKGICDTKSYIVYLTRPIEQMSKGVFYDRGISKKFNKQKWQKRIRGYFKSQTKFVLNEDI